MPICKLYRNIGQIVNIASIITRDSNVPTGVVFGPEIGRDSFGNAINTSSNMRNYLMGGNEEQTEMEGQARVVNADLIDVRSFMIIEYL